MFCILIVSCKETKKNNEVEMKTSIETVQPFFKLSLAQWSLHRMVNDDGASPFEFPKEAKNLGFDAIELVSQLYEKEVKKLGLETVIDSIKKESEKYGLKTVLIMVDHEGDLAHPDSIKRNEAVENHKKWVDAAAKLGGHSIRVNTEGTDDPNIWKNTVIDGLKKLSAYAATKNINVIAENHRGLSSNADLLMEAIQNVDMANCGTLPDFGNWCIRSKNDECIEEYHDYYHGIKLMMKTAKGVSAKSYNFDEAGQETKIDYLKMLQIVKDAGYSGYIGIEYEGSVLSEKEGILATKKLLLKSANQLN
jgi:sugar phosphate isomerase/epimerase